MPELHTSNDTARREVLTLLKAIESIEKPDISSLIIYLDTLHELDLSQAYLSVEDIRNLSEALKYTTTLSILNLAHNDINTRVYYLAKALELNTGLTALNLYGNKIDHEAIKALADALKINTRLMALDIRANNLGGEGLADLAKIITEITHRDMSNFRLQAVNNGLINISDVEEQALWEKKFALQKERFDALPKPEAIMPEQKFSSEIPTPRTESLLGILWKYRKYIAVGAAISTAAIVASAGTYGSQSKPSGRS